MLRINISGGQGEGKSRTGEIIKEYWESNHKKVFFLEEYESGHAYKYPEDTDVLILTIQEK